MHAAAIRKLEELGAAVIVFDVFFTSPNDRYDGLLADAIEAVQETGVPVVLAVNTWRVTDGRPVLSARIWEAGPRWGGATVTDSDGVYTADVLVEPAESDAIPSMSLAAVSAFVLGDGLIDFRSGPGGIEARAYERGPGSRPERIYGREFRVEPDMRMPAALNRRHGLVAGEEVSIMAPVLPTAAAFDASSLPYEELWSAHPENTRRRIVNKIALIWDGENEPPVGETTGAHIQAAVMQSLIMEYGSSLPHAWNLLLTFLGAVVSVVVVLLMCGRWPPEGRPAAVRFRRGMLAVVLGVIAASVALLAITAWVRFETAAWLYPMPGMLAALIMGLVVVMAADLRPGLPAARCGPQTRS